MTGLSIRVRGIEQVEAFLKSLPRGVMKVALDAITVYLIGDDRHGLRHYEPYKYVSRQSAYGKPFFSEKQRRYVMAAIKDGTITPGKPNRTGDAAKGYGYVETKGGYGRTITNADPGAYYARDDERQARQLGRVGWRKTAVVIASNMAGAMRSAWAAVYTFLEKGK